MKDVADDKRVALLCQHFYPEMVGTGLHMTELASSLSERGWNLRIYCSGVLEIEDPPASCEILPGIEIRRVHWAQRSNRKIASRLAGAASFVVAVGTALIRDRCDLKALLVTTNPPFLGLAALAARWLFGLPYVLIVYDVYPDIAVKLGVIKGGSLIGRLWGLLSRVTLNGAATAIVIGRDMEEVIRSKVTRTTVPVVNIPNWFDERKVKQQRHAANRFVRDSGVEGRVVVQYAGNMGRTHNLEPLISAAIELRHETNLLFQFIGDGANRPAIERMVLDANLANVQFFPYQPITRLSDVLSAADLAVVVLSSGFTGLSVPSKAYGAMAHGVPILGLVEPWSEIGRVIVESGCGVVLHPASAERIVEVLRDLVRHPDKFRSMGDAGQSAFQASHTLSRAARSYDAVLRDVLRAHTRGTLEDNTANSRDSSCGPALGQGLQ